MASEITSTSYATSKIFARGAAGKHPAGVSEQQQIHSMGPFDLLKRLVWRLLRTAFSPVLLTFTTPYQAVMFCLVSACNALLRVLVLLGSPPRVYRRAQQARDLAVALELMQQREELYRKKLLELRGELELRDKDRRKAMRKVKQLTNEVSALQGHLAEVHDETAYRAAATAAAAAGEREEAHTNGLANGGSPMMSSSFADLSEPLQLHGRTRGAHSSGVSSTSLLLSLACLAVALWSFFDSDPQSVHKKVVTAMLFPVLYCAYGALAGGGAAGAGGGGGTYSLLTYCMAWFTVGFVVCNRFTAVVEP